MSEDLLVTRTVSKGFRPGLLGRPHLVLDGCSVMIRKGESVGLMGQSGSGKSTLARICAGLEKPDAGEISFQGKPLSVMKQAEWGGFRRSVQMLFQDPGSAFHPLRTIGVSLLQVGRLYGDPDPEKTIQQALVQVGLRPEMLTRYPHQISGGQAQRLAIARILMVRPALIILDEPTSGLDILVQAQILHLLKEVQIQSGISYLLISHDLKVIRFMTTRGYHLHHGALTEF